MGTTVTRAVVVELNARRANTLVEGLQEAGIHDVTVLQEADDLPGQVAALDPHVILIDVASLQGRLAEGLFHLSQQVHRPIVIFADECDPALIHRAVQAGISGLVVDGPHKGRLGSIIEFAVVRFEQVAALQDRIERLEQALRDRKVIDKAKGILMNVRSFSEDEAHAFLRRTAMNEKKRMGDIAALIVDANRLGL